MLGLPCCAGSCTAICESLRSTFGALIGSFGGVLLNTHRLKGLPVVRESCYSSKAQFEV